MARPLALSLWGTKQVTAKLLHTGLPIPVPRDSDSRGWGESQTSHLEIISFLLHNMGRGAGSDFEQLCRPFPLLETTSLISFIALTFK